jgi:hypothetical protein
MHIGGDVRMWVDGEGVKDQFLSDVLANGHIINSLSLGWRDSWAWLCGSPLLFGFSTNFIVLGGKEIV